MTRPVDISEIVRRLADSAPALARELFPAGVREGAEYRIGSLAGDKGRSMAIHLGGARAGVWSDFASGEAGDALDLVALTLFAGDKAKAIKWARSWLGMDDGAPARLVRNRRPEKKKQDGNNLLAVFRIWNSATWSIKGTVAERYLQGRSIDLGHLGRQPSSLRFHPKLNNKESGRAWPALVAAISSVQGSLIGLHRTWLAEAADGSVGKAPLKCPKMSLGPMRGGLIRIWRGDDGTRLEDVLYGSSVVVTEGIEDALTVAMACPQSRVLCAVSLANMGSLVLPKNMSTVTICADNDEGNDVAAAGLKRAIAHFQDQGRRVLIARSAVGKDMNDLLRGTG